MNTSTAYFCVGVISVGLALYIDPLSGHFGFTVAALLCGVAAFCTGVAYMDQGR